ncbi:hypothetical protein [Paractinoplanes lichenicola]|uniref:Uncharacterized protein n=1 Tax=Paractinoplanes lichenicola TaxID=2802976 RepID=A0ABS1VXG6_9ACTN|nr:hypothetical protein [Actinoplanes lichenicola]MBL7259150.1 hypothetical protein [Actinoplanes lichenicola]
MSNSTGQKDHGRSNAATGAIIAAVVTAIGGIIATLITVYGKSDDDKTAEVRVSVSETQHGGKPINPGDDLTFSGTVEGLPGDHSLWLVSRGPESTSPYYIANGVPIVVDGKRWTAGVKSLGDSTDRGKSRIFSVVAADGACSEALAAASEQAAREKKARKISPLPSSCRSLDPKVTVRFAG